MALATHFLEKQKEALQRYLQSLDETLTEIGGLRDDEAQSLVATESERALGVLRQQILAWQRFVAGDKDFVAEQEEAWSASRKKDVGAPEAGSGSKTSFVSKMEARGFKPALPGFNLPAGAGGLRPGRENLKATASPAAQDIARLRRETGGAEASGEGPGTSGGGPASAEGQEGPSVRHLREELQALRAPPAEGAAADLPGRDPAPSHAEPRAPDEEAQQAGAVAGGRPRGPGASLASFLQQRAKQAGGEDA